ncbi:peroxiredoxin-like family protein [Roseivirga sp. BDSF3-8]|uniref:peroxiredoxin-like family protein n=1 Tax=Roseivirga sp. BDSF3-8 TaxID=3241598 RepID=UPI00353224D5
MRDKNQSTGRVLPDTKAPQLTLPLLGGGTLDLHEEASGAKNFLVVLFYRGLHCPICKKQLLDMQAHEDKFKEAGINVVAISMDEEARARKSRADWGLQDLKMAHSLPEEVARKWGLYISTAVKDGEPEVFSEPGMFILRPDGTVFGLTIQSMPFTRPGGEEVLKSLSWVAENGYPARGVA